MQFIFTVENSGWVVLVMSRPSFYVFRGHVMGVVFYGKEHMLIEQHCSLYGRMYKLKSLLARRSTDLTRALGSFIHFSMSESDAHLLRYMS